MLGAVTTPDTPLYNTPLRVSTRKKKISFLFGARPQSDTRNRFPFLLLLFAGTNVSLSFHVEKKGKNREPSVN